MARLDGKQKSPLPLIIGVAVVLILGAGGYFLLANRGADGIAVQNGSVKIVDTKPGGLLEKSPNSQSTDTQTSSAAENSNAATSSTPVADSTPGSEASTATSDQNSAATSAAQNEAAPSPGQMSSENTAMTGENTAMASATTAPDAVATPATQGSQTASTPAP